MQRIIQIYKALEQKQYPFIERIQLLAILPENMNNNKIIEKFGCSNYAIKTARKLQLATTTPTHHEEPGTVIRNRINPQQTDHFLSWLLYTNILTTVAWGITKITLDSGVVLGLIAYNLDSMLMINSVDDGAIDEFGFRRIFFNKNRPIYMLELPKQVFQGKKSHIIHQYQMHCREMALESLSDRTLRHILDGISTTEQEALSGIDDFVKDAREGWIILEKLVSFLKITKEDRDNILTTIKQNKLYLKTLFINHCSEEQTKACTTHCAVYSLSQRGSDYYNEKCDHYHNQICHDCASLIETFDLIDQQIALITDTEERNELQYDFRQAEAAIIELMRHLIRSVQQDDAKSKMLNELDDETAFVTIDWAQKILQQKHLESQSEYYGKKGMSVLVSSFTIKDCNQPQQGKFITKTYMLAITNCSQNELDTLSGGFLLLEQFKKDHQYIKKIIKRSDNASVLGGHVTFEAEKIFCDKLGVQILIRDYSEVQSGKSICDRMAGAAKLRMRAWINAGNNLLAASDIKKGMEYCGGVKNVKVVTAELINNKTKIDNADTLPEVSSIRSVVYTNDGMIITKASNIGRGRLIPYVNLQVTSNMKLIESFSPSSQQSNTTKQTERIDRKMNSFYFCPENNCICTFKDEAVLHDHIALGQHVTTGDKMNAYDIAKIQLYDKLRDVDLSTISIQPVTTSSSITTKLSEKLNGSRTMKYFSIEGWALKVQKPRRRIDEGVKSFIRTIIHEEKLYSVKFSEEEFVRRIRTARYSDGTKMFSPDQYLTASQVKTQIKLLSNKSSSTAAKEHKYVTQDSHVENDENENQYKKTPRLSRKQISIRSLTNESSFESSPQSSNEHSILNQDISDDTIDEQDELAFEQEKQIDALKKKNSKITLY